MSFMDPVVDMNLAQLKRLSLGSSVAPGDESIIMSGFRRPWYSNATIVTASGDQIVTFDFAINKDKSLSNSQAGNGGAFPMNVFFYPLTEMLWMNARMSLAGASSQVGLMDDISQITQLGRAFITLTVGPTTYPELPAVFAHGPGGPTGGVAGTWTAPNAVQWGGNGVQDGGYPIENSWVYSNQLPVSATLTIKGAITLSTNNMIVNYGFNGNWYKPVSG